MRLGHLPISGEKKGAWKKINSKNKKKMKKKKITNHDSTIKKANEPSKLDLSRKITKKVLDIRFLYNINYTWNLQLPHKNGSIEHPEIKNQTICILLFD